jgi:hypothetical protein
MQSRQRDLALARSPRMKPFSFRCILASRFLGCLGACLSAKARA